MSPTDSMGVSIPPGLPVARVSKVTLTPGAATYNLDARPTADLRDLSTSTSSCGSPRREAGAGPASPSSRCSSSAVQLVGLLDAALRRRGFMLVWLWPFALGLAGYTALAFGPRWSAGVFFDTHATTPFGLTAMVGVLLAYGASRLGSEGVGDLDSAAWWVTPLLGAVAGAAALVSTPWVDRCLGLRVVARQSRDSMVVNAVAFFVLARPVTRLARLVGRSVSGPPVKGSWRDRPTGLDFRDCGGRGCRSTPFAARAAINEPKPVGIRDLVASPVTSNYGPNVAGT